MDPMRLNHLMRRLTPAAALALGLLLGTAAWAGENPADAPSPATREAIWRAIFARPDAGAAPSSAEAAKVALGRDLFRDTRLSGSGHTSCATCHDPGRAFTDGRKTAVGPKGAVLPRNAPALYNLAWATSFFWDGRAASLADQAKVPIQAPDEMAGEVIAGLLARVPAVKPSDVEDVILGCAMPEGEQGLNVARVCALLGGLPEETARRVAAGIRTAEAAPGLAERLATAGLVLATTEGPEATAALIAADAPRWREMVQVSGARIE